MLTQQRIAEVVASNRQAALCIVTETSGSTPRKAGAKMIVFADGTDLGVIEGTVGGGAFEHEVRKRAIKSLAQAQPCHFKIALTNELGMCCGGQMTVYIEPLRHKQPLILFGAGHIALSLATFASHSGFEVHLSDCRNELLQPERFPFASSFSAHFEPSDLDRLPFGSDAFVVIVTHCHETDQLLAERILPREFRYLGLVGSKRKAAMTRQRCLNKGYSESLLDRLVCPAGIDINAETPEEIAVSIVSQMIQVKRTNAKN